MIRKIKLGLFSLGVTLASMNPLHADTLEEQVLNNANSTCESDIDLVWESTINILGLLGADLINQLVQLANKNSCQTPSAVSVEMVQKIVKKEIDTSFITFLNSGLKRVIEKGDNNFTDYAQVFGYAEDANDVLATTENLTSFEAAQSQMMLATLGTSFLKIAEVKAVEEYSGSALEARLSNIQEELINLVNRTLKVLAKQEQSFESYINDDENYEVKYEYDLHYTHPEFDKISAIITFDDGTTQQTQNYLCFTPLGKGRCYAGDGLANVNAELEQMKNNFKNQARAKLFGNKYHQFVARLAKSVTVATNFCEGRPAIFRMAEKDLTLHTWGGSFEGYQIRLHGGLEYALDRANSQYRIVDSNNNWAEKIFKAEDANLTMHAWGGSNSRADIRLHHGVHYANQHANSKFRIVESGDHYLLKVSNADLTMHAYGGAYDGAKIKLYGGVNYAQSRANSKFLILCK